MVVIAFVLVFAPKWTDIVNVLVQRLEATVGCFSFLFTRPISTLHGTTLTVARAPGISNRTRDPNYPLGSVKAGFWVGALRPAVNGQSMNFSLQIPGHTREYLDVSKVCHLISMGCFAIIASYKHTRAVWVGEPRLEASKLSMFGIAVKF